MPTCLPIVLRCCNRCASARSRARSKLRIHADHELLHAWLFPLCSGCGGTTNLSGLERIYVRSARFELLKLRYDRDPGLAAELLQDPVAGRRGVGGSVRAGRPAWQSPYGPPPHRAHRGRWVTVPVLARSRCALRRGHLSRRCD
ncbi:DUF1062 domain-containing protein [Streptomyces echinatus]|uniref:DUF1062 domain-containing protein n=1 Tax=Streptomyces echinatus TaxID=67293 RepID=UPI0037B502F2